MICPGSGQRPAAYLLAAGGALSGEVRCPVCQVVLRAEPITRVPEHERPELLVLS